MPAGKHLALTVETIMSNLDKDFDGIVGQINVKLAEAASAMKEANVLRKKAGYLSLIFHQGMSETFYDRARDILDESGRYDDQNLSGVALEEQEQRYDLELEELIEAERAKYERFKVSALEEELHSAGWSTSSSYC